MINEPCRCFLAAVTVIAALVGTDALAQEGDWAIEAGALVGHHGNFFYRGENAPAPSTGLFNVYLNGEGEYRRPSGRYTVFFDAGTVRTGSIEDGGYYSLLGGLEYRRGQNRITGEASLLPNRVYDEEGDGVFFDLFGTEIEYRRGLGPGLWVRGSYEVDLWRFDPEERERDSTTHGFTGTVRVPLHERAGVRGTIYYSLRGALDDRFDYSSLGVGAALEAQPTDAINIFVRYRVRGREYNGAESGENNFLREDTIHDLVANIRWQVGPRWGIRIENFYRTGSSTRFDRNYSGNRIMGGAFVLF